MKPSPIACLPNPDRTSGREHVRSTPLFHAPYPPAFSAHVYAPKVCHSLPSLACFSPGPTCAPQGALDFARSEARLAAWGMSHVGPPQPGYKDWLKEEMDALNEEFPAQPPVVTAGDLLSAYSAHFCVVAAEFREFLARPLDSVGSP